MCPARPGMRCGRRMEGLRTPTNPEKPSFNPGLNLC